MVRIIATMVGLGSGWEGGGGSVEPDEPLTTVMVVDQTGNVSKAWRYKQDETRQGVESH